MTLRVVLSQAGVRPLSRQTTSVTTPTYFVAQKGRKGDRLCRCDHEARTQVINLLMVGEAIAG